MRRGARLPSGQAEVVFSDVVAEQLEQLSERRRVEVLAEIVRLCDNPGGKHPLRAPLAGWNTLDVLAGDLRVVYRASTPGGVGLIEVLCVGARSDSEVYDVALAAVRSGQLRPDENTDLFQLLALLDVVAEEVGLDGWDYRPPPAPEGMRRAAVAAGLLDTETAGLLGKDEIEAAMAEGWGPGGAEPERALNAALRRARGSIGFDSRRVMLERADDRCGAPMERARASCIRREAHPGPHRAV